MNEEEASNRAIEDANASTVERLREELAELSSRLAARDGQLAASRRKLGRAMYVLVAITLVGLAAVICGALVFDRAISWVVARKCGPGSLASPPRAIGDVHLDRMVWVSTPESKSNLLCAIDVDATAGGGRFEVVHELRVTCNESIVYAQSNVIQHDAQVRAQLSRRGLSLTYFATWSDATGNNLVCLTNGADDDRTNRMELHQADSVQRLLSTAPAKCLAIRDSGGTEEP